MNVSSLCRREVIGIAVEASLYEAATVMAEEHVRARVTGSEPGVPAEASIDHAVQAMQRSGVRCLLIMGKDNSVLGLVSADDLLGPVAGELDGTLRNGVPRGGTRERTSRAPAEGDSSQALSISRDAH